ncbi:MAG: methionine biosynthesis protein MetW [Spirochaetota bacterium]|nr:methionine biosynthesis protein MetW [Spirochaetota bacterium]
MPERETAGLRARVDFDIVSENIDEGAKVLDVGCGDGTLLGHLVSNKRVKARGIEIDEENVLSCVNKGLSVLQGDIDEGLNEHYKDNSFDYVIALRTVQVVLNPKESIDEMLRIGKKAIISFPNFAHFRVRFGLLFKGRMPKNRLLPYDWYDTPNIHVLTIRDFIRFCNENGITIEKHFYLASLERRRTFLARIWPNFFAYFGLFLISRS